MLSEAALVHGNAELQWWEKAYRLLLGAAL